MDQFLYKDTVEGKSAARRQLDSLLDGLDDREISIVAATAQAIIDARTEGGERLRPTFLFLLEEKKKRADLRAKSLASLGCALYPGGGRLSAVGTGFPSCAADAKPCGGNGICVQMSMF